MVFLIHQSNHASIHPCVHTCIPYKSVDRSAHSSLPSYGRERAPPLQLSSLLLNQDPLREKRTAQLQKGAKKLIPGLKRPAHRSFSGPPFCSEFPTPTVPSSGAVGDARRC